MELLIPKRTYWAYIQGVLRGNTSKENPMTPYQIALYIRILYGRDFTSSAISQAIRRVFARPDAPIRRIGSSAYYWAGEKDA